MQLWQHSVFILLKIINSFFDKNNNIIDNYLTHNDIKYSENSKINKHQYISSKGTQNFLELLSEKEILNMWETSISCFESIFNHTNSILNNSNNLAVSTNILEELIRSCQEMNIQIISFIVNTLIPNSFRIQKSLQSKLISLLDIGCNFDINSNSQINSSSFSRVVVNNLFELCRFKDDETAQKGINNLNLESVGISNLDEYNKIKGKLSKITTPILIKKCREILKKYIEDEMKSGSIPLTRTRVEDIKFVLEMLKNHEIYTSIIESDDPEVISNMDIGSNNYFQNAVASSRKAHLFNLIHTFSDMVMTKENEIRLIVKDIFKIISNEISSQK